MLRRHPSFRRLQAFSDGTLPQDKRQQVADHLTGCAHCRSQHEFLRRLADLAPQIYTPSPPSGLLREVLARREAGERVILPSAPPPPLGRRSEMGVAVAVLVTVGLAAVTVLTTSEAGASASLLRVDPARPTAGEPIEFEYRASSLLRGHETLRLQGRYRTADDGPIRGVLGHEITGTLRRSRGGKFSGTLTLPGSAVYALFAVEDSTGTLLDSNGRELWEVLETGPHGAPTLAALRQKYRVLERRDWQGATEVARAMTVQYPEEAEGWGYLLTHELQLVGPERKDSLRSDHRARFLRLEANALKTDPPATDQLANLTVYARLVDERESYARLSERLLELAPHHPQSVQYRVRRNLERAGQDAEGALKALEDEWRRSGPATEYIAQRGFAYALQLRDPELVELWTDRYLRFQENPGARLAVIRALLDSPVTRPVGVSRLEAHLRRLAAVGATRTRPLDESLAEYEGFLRDHTAAARAALGVALLDAGQHSEGLRELHLAGRDGWQPAIYADLARVSAKSGDTTSAAHWGALAAADPLIDSSEMRSLAQSATATFDSVAWAQRVRAHQLEMRDRLLADEPSPRPLPLGVDVMDGTGASHRLRDLGSGRPFLLVYWSRYSWPAVEGLQGLRALLARPRLTFAEVVTVTPNSPSADLAAFLERLNLGLPVYHDVQDRASDALHAWGTPRYYVIDARSRVRLDTDDIERALRHLHAVMLEAAPASP